MRNLPALTLPLVLLASALVLSACGGGGGGGSSAPSSLGSLRVTPGQSVVVGATSSLAYTALDVDGNAMDASVLAPTWRIVSGEGDVLALVDPKGRVKGLREGAGSVRVAVGSVVSEPAGVTATAAPSPLQIVDPGFEEGGGWTYGRGSRRTDGGRRGIGYARLEPIGYALEEGGGGDGGFKGRTASLTQPVGGLIPGVAYRLTFWARQSATGTSVPVKVELGGASSAIPFPASSAGAQWAEYSTTFTATGPTSALRFSSGFVRHKSADWTNLIDLDDVAVRPLP